MSVGKRRLDLVIENQVVVELKAVAGLSEIHTAQAISYLRATGLEVALLMNFGGSTLIWKRLIKTKN
jgi:GxxExxY protein